MKSLIPAIPVLVFTAACCAWAAQPDRIAGTIENGQKVTITGTVPPRAKSGRDLGPLNASTKLTHVSLLIKPSAEQQAELDQLLAEQQNPSSPNFRKWLTPEEFGERFGLSQNDLDRITRWLLSEGFSIAEVAHSRTWIAIDGTVAQIERTFRTQMHRFALEGEEHFSNATDLSIPEALKDIVVSFRGLDNFKIKSDLVKSSAASPDFSAYGNNYMVPNDIATIYDISALYFLGAISHGNEVPDLGINGRGIKIAVMGVSDFQDSDITDYQTSFGWTTSTVSSSPTLATGCSDPGFPDTEDELEADLDLEIASAVARSASITLYNCDRDHGGAIQALAYAIDNNVAPILSMSFSSCEADLPSSFYPAYEAALQQANSQGQTVVVSTGDTGAANCDDTDETLATLGPAVSGFATPPEVTAVGGTEFNEGSGNYWASTNPTNDGTALSYIPELAWNDTMAGTGFSSAAQSGGTLAATGGGTSTKFPAPSFQTGGVWAANNIKFRTIPDVSFAASPYHDGYVVCSQNSCSGGIGNWTGPVVGGTSASTPLFAGIIALLDQFQHAPQGLGNINPTLYSLAQNAPTAFNDTPAGYYNISGALSDQSGNGVPCEEGTPNCAKANEWFGYLTAAGYDEATGWGSVNAAVFVDSWPRFIATPTFSPAAGSYDSAQSVTISETSSGAVIYYTVTAGATGTTPTTSSTVYSGPITVSSTETLEAIATITGYSTSAVGSATYTIVPAAATPTFSPAGGTYASPQSVTISDSTPGVAIYYTTNGSTPTTSSSVYSSAITVSSTETIEAIAAAAGYTNSAVATASYTITEPNFTLFAAPASLTVATGATGTSTLTVTPANGFNSAVSFACSGQPTGVTCTFNPTTATPAGGAAATTQLTVTASDLATVSSTPVTVTLTGTSGTLSASASIALTITAEPGFTVGTGGTTSITLNPGATTGNTGSISVVGTNGFTGTVNLSCAVTTAMTSVNDKPTCSLSPTSVTLSGTTAQSSTLTVNTTAASSAENRMQKLFWPATGGTSLALILLLCVPRRQRNWVAMLVLLALFVSVGAVGCGGGSNSGGCTTNCGGGNPGTTPGIYTITVTGTGTSSGSSSSVTATVGTVTLTVD